MDLLQIWSASLDVLKQGEVFDTLESFKAEGLTRFIGYSGDGNAARYAVETGRLDALQTSISVADQEAIDLTLPLCRERNMGVIAKRPLANVAWIGDKPDYFPGYGSEYARRLQQLDYPFIRTGGSESVSSALRFTLSVPGVDVAIAGSKRPGRWEENAAFLESGLLDDTEFNAIRRRWMIIADASWHGQR